MRLGLAAAVLLTSAACSPAPSDPPVLAKYDQATGKLSQLTVNSGKDGKPNVISYMDGTKFVRIEIDADEDGKVDRWEYYGPTQRVDRVGISRANDGNADTWMIQGSDGSVSRIEVSTKHDGRVNRTEFYNRDELTRVEEDTDADGRVDKWEEYESGVLVKVSFDTAKSGHPRTTLDYRK
jgi:hypothetical protein